MTLRNTLNGSNNLDHFEKKDKKDVVCYRFLNINSFQNINDLGFSKNHGKDGFLMLRDCLGLEHCVLCCVKEKYTIRKFSSQMT